jgi:hypothetical protein
MARATSARSTLVVSKVISKQSRLPLFTIVDCTYFDPPMVDILLGDDILVIMESSFLSRLLFFVLCINTAAIVVVFAVYFKDRHSFKDHTCLEKYCKNLPKDAKISDPQVLVEGKWVKRESLDKDQLV